MKALLEVIELKSDIITTSATQGGADDTTPDNPFG